jgi:hypothetical protein
MPLHIWTAITKKGPAWMSNEGRNAGKTWLLDNHFAENYLPIIEEHNG